MKIIKYCKTSEFMRTLPVYTFFLALFKVLMCSEGAYHHDWWCLPWQIVLLPTALYVVYFLASLIEAVRLATKAANYTETEDIDIEVG